ncbi:nuclear transport factor 2 family protein [Streptomyces sp. NPDC002911]
MMDDMEMSTMSRQDPVERLRDAINSHDPQRVADCFTLDYVAEVPHRPAEGFTGNEHVLANWTAIYGRLPDIRAQLLRRATAGPEFWTEWEMVGTGPDGATVVLGGPAIIWTRDGRIARSRFYLGPVPAPAPTGN